MKLLFVIWITSFLTLLWCGICWNNGPHRV